MEYTASAFSTASGAWTLVSDGDGDTGWLLRPSGAETCELAGGEALDGGRYVYPASWDNLLTMKNLVQEADPGATIFPTAGGTLHKKSLGIGARFTAMHWPAVDWAMAQLDISLTANQNSIPRELVYDVNAMLDGELDMIPFPFIGASIPEGHQGQSVEGMSHGSVLAKLKHGFHQNRLPWGFNADHQPVGGKYDSREDGLVRGSLMATYITYDISHELVVTPEAKDPAAYIAKEIPTHVLEYLSSRFAELDIPRGEQAAFEAELAMVWPAMRKMKQRDVKYAAARVIAFTTEVGRRYFRELSVDELPGNTTAARLAICLCLCECMDMRAQYVAPAFGFQKNFPYPDNAALETMVGEAYAVCAKFSVSIGFHSGSGKSAENYEVCGRATGGNLEIKTSGRYTYEMGRALFASSDPTDQQLWSDWYAWTTEIALNSCFSENAEQQKMAREFVLETLHTEDPSADEGVFSSVDKCRQALTALTPDPDHMTWFEYNFLYVLCAGGAPEPKAMGSHNAEGYAQRSRFYGISAVGRLEYSKRVAEYICFLARTTGLVAGKEVSAVEAKLKGYTTYAQLLGDIRRDNRGKL